MSVWSGEGRKGRGGGGTHLPGDGPAEGVEAEEGYFLGYFFGLDVYVGVPNL